MTDDLARLADQRAGLAALVGLLLLEEPGPHLAELVGAVPGLAALGADDPHLRSEFERVLLREVPPYESVFRSDDGQRGGPISDAVLDRYRDDDFDEVGRGRWRVGGPDHLGLELRCYASLCQSEAAAWRAGTPDLAARAVERERELLADHLIGWAPAALLAVEAEAAGTPYEDVARCTLELLHDEVGRLRPSPDLSGFPGSTAPSRGSFPARLGPSRLARSLLAPGVSGVWLTRDDLRAAALALGAPWRPSDTRSRLRHLVDDAADAGLLSEVLAPLRDAARRATATWDHLAVAHPGAAGAYRSWSARAWATVQALEAMIERGAINAESVGATREVIEVEGADPAALADALDQVVGQLRAAGFSARVVERQEPAGPSPVAGGR